MLLVIIIRISFNINYNIFESAIRKLLYLTDEGFLIVHNEVTRVLFDNNSALIKKNEVEYQTCQLLFI